ncbi:hypothetical protein IFM89_008387 [Coptis chinensis]|uniref:Uncharacterized protein n=1 Tax=Coptis chinensis TaxID=261450 RepID=A0A835LHX8_9MAGN|nr:hypothetical protein IFM89_008387 [Coptis chinensis]
MASNLSISIKLLVDKKKNRVLYAESDHAFVDILFSFLTLPMGTITRLLCTKSSVSEIGCMRNLYYSVNDLSTTYLRTDACKKMLLYPHRAAEAECRKLKFNLEGRKNKELYLCGAFSSECMLGVYYGVPCFCGAIMNHKAYLDESSCASGGDHADSEGVFVKGALGEGYIISDDLQVMPGSISSCMSMLDKLGIGDDMSSIEERIVTVGSQEILQLLRRSWCSHTALTDVFLSNQGAIGISIIRSAIRKEKEKAIMNVADKKFKLKLVLRKSTEDVLYAEAEPDFINQLLSFLTFPLGSVFNLFVDSTSSSKLENDEKKNTVIADGLVVRNPKSPFPDAKTGGGFVKGPSRFMITDDLVLTPLSHTSCLLFLKTLNVRFDDIEEHVVNVGENEVLNLLKASLISDTALSTLVGNTDVIYSVVQNQEMEVGFGIQANRCYCSFQNLLEGKCKSENHNFMLPSANSNDL